MAAYTFFLWLVSYFFYLLLGSFSDGLQYTLNIKGI